MTDVPDHLLQRSRERRAALGLGGDGGSDAPSAAPAAGAPAAAVEAAGSAEVVEAAPIVPEAPPPPPPPYVEAALRRPKVPRFAVPVLASLPLWAFIYAGTMTAGSGETLDPQLALGQSVYAANCASCHGSEGQGGVGRPLGEVLATFPDRADHVAWVVNGSPAPGTPYGDPAAGRVSQSGGFGAMPGFGGSLSEEEIDAVVRYEREEIGGEEPAGAQTAGGEGTTGSGEPTDSAAETEAETEGGDVGGETSDHE